MIIGEYFKNDALADQLMEQMNMICAYVSKCRERESSYSDSFLSLYPNVR